MGKDILKLEPKAVWEVFYELTQIPRPSKHEEKVEAFAEQFGKSLGLETKVDRFGNVIIRKPATAGMENRRGVILQAHLDMVPQKNAATQHNFETDPIDAIIDGEWVRAKGTTLGADNGIGASAALAILASKNIPHGPLEVLLTSDEETGMTGANNIKPGILQGEILLNLDSEDEGELYIGCAGGVNTNALLKYKPVEVPPNFVPYRISITGLRGGHSGLEINLGRGNANKIMNGLLMEAAGLGLRLAHIEGGNLRNAIPRESFATVAIHEKNKEALKALVNQYEHKVKAEFSKADPGLMMTIAPTKMPDNLLDEQTQAKLFTAIEGCPNGVIAMMKEMPGVVETSNNLAIIRGGNGEIEIASLQRSAVDADRAKLAKQVHDVLIKAGAVAEITGDYPGWKPNVHSPILETMKKVYQEKYGKTPEVKVIHAGLECGILGAKYPHWDMISFGPTIRHPHSPDEKVKIDTVGMFFDYLVETLKAIPKA